MALAAGRTSSTVQAQPLVLAVPLVGSAVILLGIAATDASPSTVPALLLAASRPTVAAQSMAGHALDPGSEIAAHRGTTAEVLPPTVGLAVNRSSGHAPLAPVTFP